MEQGAAQLTDLEQEGLGEAIERVAADTAFSGVVRADLGNETAFAGAFGLADRAHGVANAIDTRFAIASASKGFTALMVMRLVELGRLALSTPARQLLGADLPLIDESVTVEHLLAHRAGIGDYLDEEAAGDITDYPMTVPVHRLATTEGFLPMLAELPPKFPAGERFSYCNGGFVVLALLAERATGGGFHDLVDRLVIEPAWLARTAYLRTDELPGDAAVGYLDTSGLRSNVLHLPVRGNGDGGAYATAGDLHRFWQALFAGRVVSPATVAEMVRPRSDSAENGLRYGLGFWLHATSDAVHLEGYDAGVSCRSVHQPSRGLTYTVIANTSEGAWPLVRLLRDRVG